MPVPKCIGDARESAIREALKGIAGRFNGLSPAERRTVRAILQTLFDEGYDKGYRDGDADRLLAEQA